MSSEESAERHLSTLWLTPTPVGDSPADSPARRPLAMPNPLADAQSQVSGAALRQRALVDKPIVWTDVNRELGRGAAEAQQARAARAAGAVVEQVAVEDLRVYGERLDSKARLMTWGLRLALLSALVVYTVSQLKGVARAQSNPSLAITYATAPDGVTPWPSLVVCMPGGGSNTLLSTLGPKRERVTHTSGWAAIGASNRTELMDAPGEYLPLLPLLPGGKRRGERCRNAMRNPSGACDFTPAFADGFFHAAASLPSSDNAQTAAREAGVSTGVLGDELSGHTALLLYELMVITPQIRGLDAAPMRVYLSPRAGLNESSARAVCNGAADIEPIPLPPGHATLVKFRLLESHAKDTSDFSAATLEHASFIVDSATRIMDAAELGEINAIEARDNLDWDILDVDFDKLPERMPVRNLWDQFYEIFKDCFSDPNIELTEDGVDVQNPPQFRPMRIFLQYNSMAQSGGGVEIERRSLQTSRTYSQLAGEVAGLWSAAHGALTFGVRRLFKYLSSRRDKQW